MSEHGGWLGGWLARICSPSTYHPLPCPSRLQTLAMRLAALLLRVLARLGFAPKAEEVSQYLEM